MKRFIKRFLSFLATHSSIARKNIAYLFPSYVSITKNVMQEQFLKDYIHAHYPKESIDNKLFYNIGAGNQRSQHDIWTYMDLKSELYNNEGIDIFYNLEALEAMPLIDEHAEVIFSSFVIEHISMNATKNLCREAYRVLKEGGVFHSKVHCFDYGRRLLKHNLISPKIPFECRETITRIDNFITQHRGGVRTFFDEQKRYIIQSTKQPEEQISFSAAEAFIYHNVNAAYDNLEGKFDSTLAALDKETDKAFFQKLRTHIDEDKKQPYQHNADYFPQDELFLFIKNLGFSEVYFTQPYQSISPALWDEALNPIHRGFLFTIEAVK